MVTAVRPLSNNFLRVTRFFSVIRLGLGEKPQPRPLPVAANDAFVDRALGRWHEWSCRIRAHRKIRASAGLPGRAGPTALRRAACGIAPEDSSDEPPHRIPKQPQPFPLLVSRPVPRPRRMLRRQRVPFRMRHQPQHPTARTTHPRHVPLRADRIRRIPPPAPPFASTYRSTTSLTAAVPRRSTARGR